MFGGFLFAVWPKEVSVGIPFCFATRNWSRHVREKTDVFFTAIDRNHVSLAYFGGALIAKDSSDYFSRICQVARFAGTAKHETVSRALRLGGRFLLLEDVE